MEESEFGGDGSASIGSLFSIAGEGGAVLLYTEGAAELRCSNADRSGYGLPAGGAGAGIMFGYGLPSEFSVRLARLPAGRPAS